MSELLRQVLKNNRLKNRIIIPSLALYYHPKRALITRQMPLRQINHAIVDCLNTMKLAELLWRDK